MQTIFWEEEFKLIDCLLYDIDFEQDFTNTILNERMVPDMSSLEIIEYLTTLEIPEISDTKPIIPCYLTSNDWKKFDKKVKKEIEAEEKREYENSFEYYRDLDDEGVGYDEKKAKKAWKKTKQKEAVEGIEIYMKKIGTWND